MIGTMKFAAAVLTASIAITGANRLVFTPKENPDPIVNPHKGFVQNADDFNASSSSAKLTEILYSEISADELKSGDGFVLTPVDNALKSNASSGRTSAVGISCGNVSDSQVLVKLADALSARYDGNKDIEFIAIDLPECEEAVQKEILEGWDKAFSRTPLAFDPDHALYGYASSLGMFPYDSDASLSEADRNLCYYPLTQAGYEADTALAEELQNALGYNLSVKFASFYFEKNEAVLSVKICNTGSAPQNFDITLEAAVCDKNGTSFARTGSTSTINADSLDSGNEQTYELRFDRNLIPNKNDVYIAIGAFENSDSISPDIKLANRTTGGTNYIVLGQVK